MRHGRHIVWKAGVVAAVAAACSNTIVAPGSSSGAVSASAASSSSGSTGGVGGAGGAGGAAGTAGAGGACAGHLYYAGLYPNAPAEWSNLPDAEGFTSLMAGDAQCKGLGIGADHVCDLTEVQAANAHQEPLFMAVPAGTTAWMQRTTPVYVEGLSGTPCTAAMAGQADPGADCSSACQASGDVCGANSDCCTDVCTGGTCAAGPDAPCVCELSQPGPGGTCNGWTYPGHYIGEGEYIVFGPSGGVPTAPGLPASPGDPGFHYDNDTIFNPNDPGADIHHSSDFTCALTLRAILCCYPSCM